MSYEDFKRSLDQARDRNGREFYEGLDRELKKRGHPGIDAAVGARPEEPGIPVTAKTLQVVRELGEYLGENEEKVMRRAVGLLRSAVAHAKKDGTIEFVGADGSRRHLKLPKA